MRISAAIDLAPVRAEAVRQIDEAFARWLLPSAMTAVWAEKARRAEDVLSGASDPILAEEAALRGVTPAALAAAIRAAAAAETVRVMAIEMDRQRLKARVAAAQDQHGVLAVLAEIV